MPSKLEQLKAMTTVVADTGDIDAIKQWQPIDATTNPSLLLKAAALPSYASLIDQCLDYARSQSKDLESQVSLAGLKLSVLIGQEITQVVPGRVSTEVDARLSFDTQATVNQAKTIIDLYESLGTPRERILIKIASTWEGIRAAEILEQENIQCNLTLMFSFCQAVAAAQAGAFLISPFVGRILDWYKASTGKDHYEPFEDPGVQSVTQIYNYYKACGYETIVMGASFRNVGEIEALAGCDRLTISPDLLEALDQDTAELPRALAPAAATQDRGSNMTEADFRWMLNEDAMATEKLADGIRRFAADQVRLEAQLREKLS